MAGRKDNSRNKDRVRIKRLHAQGFALDQIVTAVNITPEHVTYILEQYEVDLAGVHKKQKELDAFRAAEKLAQQQLRPVNVPVNPPPDLEAMRAEIEEKVRAEYEAKAKAEKEEEEFVETQFEDEAEIETETAKKARPKRKQRRAA